MNSSSRIVGPELLRIFGISVKNVKCFTIKCDVNENIAINVKYVGDLNNDTKEFEEIVKEFTLVKK